MAKPYDAALKRILDDYAPQWIVWLEPFLGLPLGPVEAIDPDLSTVQPTADKVFRLPNGAGLLHLEVQSSHDINLADRLLVYNVLLHQRHGGPVHSLALLLRRHANSPSLTGTLVRHRGDGRELLRFEYDVIRVWELSAETLLAGGLGIAPLALLTDDAAGRLPAVLRRLADRTEAELPNPAARDRLLTASSLLMGMRYDEGVIRSLFMGVQQMRESSMYQAILREGEVAALRRTLIALLESKFGSLPPGLESRIQSIDDARRLDSAIQRILTIAVPEELGL